MSTLSLAFDRPLSRPYVDPLLTPGDILAFLLAATIWIKMQVVGDLLGADLVSLVALPVLLALRGRRLASHFSFRFISLSLLAFASLVLTDVWRATPSHDLERGWARYLCFLLSFCVLYMLLSARPQRCLYFAFGIVAQDLLGFFVAPSDFARDSPWKFGLGHPITLLIILVAVVHDAGRAQRRWAGIACFLAGALNFAMNFRSLAGICVIAGLLLSIASGTVSSRRRFSTPIMVFVIFVAVFGTLELYETLASDGSLGSEAQKKYDDQAGGEFGILGGGRSEFFGSLLAIRDSPLLGHGSWAKDPKYSWQLERLRAAAGYRHTGGGDSFNGLIPSHSHLFGAWVEAGFLGTLVWVWVLARAGRQLLVVPQSAQYPALRTFACCSLIWDVLFSPPGGMMRYITVFNLIVVCLPERTRDSEEALSQ